MQRSENYDELPRPICTAVLGLMLLIHGFRVRSTLPVPSGFKRALREIAARGFLDPSCTVVKTAAGSTSGITHAGGRYLHGHNAFAPSALAIMGAQGIDPPPLPFVVAPGPATLFHEWGHHVDHLWSGGDQDVTFSLPWLSVSYELRCCVARPGLSVVA